MSKVLVSPSILSCNFANLESECKMLEQSGADWIHCDVMDGVFVPNITFGMPVVGSLRRCVGLPLDVHLMIDHPEKYVTQFAEAGADIITFHIEATDKVSDTIRLIHSCGKKAGLSVKPNTPIGALTPYRGLFDMVLVMSVEPGFGGQQFIPSALDKIRRAKTLFPNVPIEVDGGINAETAKQVREAGVDIIVAGSAIFSAPDRAAAIKKIRGGR